MSSLRGSATLAFTHASARVSVCREYNPDNNHYTDMIKGIRDAYHTLKGRAVLRGILFVQVGCFIACCRKALCVIHLLAS